MQTFLQMVAHDLYRKLGNDMSRTVIVFPNKRANLFFNEYLAGESDRPVWAPAAMSISDLFRKLSNLKVGDPIRLVCELYPVFCKVTGSQETLDDFYYWGELLISDFDDVDKNLVDASQLFSNLKDLRQIADDYTFLEPEQEAAIKQFFRNFSIEKRTLLKERFASLWDSLGSIYSKFRERLQAEGIAYEGMLYRRVIEELDVDRLKYDRYIFVGFNVLNRVEQTFFQRLRDAGKAMFYWDYDAYYVDRIPGHEAGEFIRRNLREFGNELPASCFDVLGKPKKVRYISAPTENAQARFLPEWVRETFGSSVTEKENAVVLCNEALLLPVLHSIPEEVKNVNITMGFPLSQTPVYSFLNAVMEMQTTGYNRDSGRYTYETVSVVLKHPYTRQLSEHAESLERTLTETNRFYPLPSELRQDGFLEKLFAPQEGLASFCAYLTGLIRDISVLYRQEQEKGDIFDQLYRESIFQSYVKVNRIYGLVEEGKLQVRVDMLRRLINKVLTSANIPFHGEPAIGMQVMGVLETRCLDFRNLIMLSLNEGQLPKSGGDSSFIPYNLRKAFGMTTIDHKNAVYAYYFYRLIQRAEQVTLLYNTSSDGLNRGEWSRFMLQFLVESPHDIQREYLEAGQSPKQTSEILIPKTPEIMERLRSAYDVNSPQSFVLSPSALNAYLDCRLRFYYYYVARLQAPDEVSAEIDSALFGTIFHRAAQLVYLDLTAHGRMIQKHDLEKLLKDDVRLQGYVDRSFKENLFKVPLDEEPEYNGTQLINSKVIASYLRQLLRNDLQYAPFEMMGMEQKVYEEMEVSTPEGNIRLRLGGTIDRMDRKEGTLRIVDYKTGGSPKAATGVEQLFIPADNRPNYVLQTFIYAAIMCRKQSYKVAPSLLYIHKASSESYSPVIEMGEPRKPKVPVTDFSLLETEFREHLQRLLEEIFNPAEPFSQTEDRKKCEYCDFKAMCRR